VKKFISFFIQGLILFIPIIITFAILFKLYDFFQGLFSYFGIVENTILNTIIGLGITVGAITAMGVIASSYVFTKFFSVVEDKLEHAPFIRHIYAPIKDFTNAFMGNKKRFNKPVLVVTNPQANIEEIGFLTNDDLTELHIKEKVAVYLPYSYSLSGRLVIVPRDQVKPLEADAADTMKFVVSGGVADVEEHH
jgi:uncharacterized membrane protein